MGRAARRRTASSRWSSSRAPVIRRYALDFPEHVAGLVAVDGSLDVRGFGRGGRAGGGAFAVAPAMRESMIRGMFVPETPPQLQQHILDMMLGAPEATASGAMAAMFGQRAEAGEVISAPALAVVAGTAQVPGTGHFLMMEKPGEFNRLLSAFLEQVGF